MSLLSTRHYLELSDYFCSKNWNNGVAKLYNFCIFDNKMLKTVFYVSFALTTLFDLENLGPPFGPKNLPV